MIITLRVPFNSVIRWRPSAPPHALESSGCPEMEPIVLGHKNLYKNRFFVINFKTMFKNRDKKKRRGKSEAVKWYENWLQCQEILAVSVSPTVTWVNHLTY